MAIKINTTLAACAFALAAAAICAAPAGAAAPESNHPKADKVLKAKAKAKSKGKKATAAAAAAVAAGTIGVAAASEPEPDLTDSVSTEYDCELGNKITIYTNAKDDATIALRWKKRLHRMSRVGTSTGALRFENPGSGLVWIGIPAKGMLLDSKQNRQLANECKNAEQAKPVVVAAPEEKTA